ncbi:MAG: fused MFS/spermidine synthase [Dehalococcoidia bacterium]|nr:fused MFS/spermidine synthase [Dehalococcoidia bacterium]
MSLLLARALVFYSSAAVLVLEILAGRLMAPYIGVTLETFTGIIGVVLAGIAGGSWMGGRIADRTDPRALLGPALIASGVLALAVPTIVDGLGPWMRAGGPMEIVALTTCAFFLPSFLLSAIPPLVVKLRLRSLDETGTVVGSLSAVSTWGALAGTFLTGFVFVAALPTRPLVLGLGALLVLSGLPMLRRTLPGATLIGGVLITLAATASLGMADGPCQWQTNYFCASVELDEDRPSGRLLWLDTLRHSYVDLEDPTYLEFRYARGVADVLSLLPEGPLHGVFIGGGGFTLPRYVPAVRPGSTSTVFEIDGALVDLVKRELGLVPSADLRVEVGDARLALPDQPSDSADFVVGDAFGGLSVPWHLTTREFMREVDRVLRPGGVYVVNVIDYPPLGFAKAEAATFLEVFEHVAVIAPLRHLIGEGGGNFVLVGSHAPLDAGALQALADARADDGDLVWSGDRARDFADDARVLRDDFAPVDQLLGRP